MDRRILFKTMLTSVSVSMFAAISSPVLAQEEAAAEEAPAAEENATAAKNDNVFCPLIRCIISEGTVQVLRPRTTEWIDAVEGRYYPLGSVIRVSSKDGEKPNADFEFGEKSHVIVKSDAEFATREAEGGAQMRVVDLRAGRIEFSLPPTLGEGRFKVVAPAFYCENLAGDSAFEYSKEADGDEAIVRCVTGKFKLTGNHYSFPEMLAANQVRIRTTGDMLFTSIRGESGVCKAELDQGVVAEKDFETGESKEVARRLDFQLSPQCSIKIFRAKASVGGRVSVSTMTFSPSGDMLNRFAFAEGRTNINSGELVIPEKIVEEAKPKTDEGEEESEAAEEAPAQEAGEAKEEEEESEN